MGDRVYLDRWSSSGMSGWKACSLEKFTEEGAKPIDPPRYSRDRRLPLAFVSQRFFVPWDLPKPMWAGRSGEFREQCSLRTKQRALSKASALLEPQNSFGGPEALVPMGSKRSLAAYQNKSDKATN